MDAAVGNGQGFTGSGGQVGGQKLTIVPQGTVTESDSGGDSEGRFTVVDKDKEKENRILSVKTRNRIMRFLVSRQEVDRLVKPDKCKKNMEFLVSRQEIE
uniref:KID domain-containing protein n=1 Tax=Strongyloides papillosus TaxID=174720 RepID=A0A0N5BCA2_STREA